MQANDATYNLEILSLIPQRPPFVMVDRFLEESPNQKNGISSFTVREENIFVEDRLFREPGLVENMAQTAAARIGYICKSEKKPVPIGYIGAVQNLEILHLPKLNDELRTEISVTNEIFNVTIIEGKVSCNGKLMAKCEMKIFISNQQ